MHRDAWTPRRADGDARLGEDRLQLGGALHEAAHVRLARLGEVLGDVRRRGTARAVRLALDALAGEHAGGDGTGDVDAESEALGWRLEVRLQAAIDEPVGRLLGRPARRGADQQLAPPQRVSPERTRWSIAGTVSSKGTLASSRWPKHRSRHDKPRRWSGRSRDWSARLRDSP